MIAKSYTTMKKIQNIYVIIQIVFDKQKTTMTWIICWESVRVFVTKRMLILTSISNIQEGHAPITSFWMSWATIIEVSKL